jgi:surface polysaccharide O-acyltransferase-like enzyme
MKIKSRFSIGTFSIENSNSKNQISSHPGILLYHERTGTYKIRLTRSYSCFLLALFLVAFSYASQQTFHKNRHTPKRRRTSYVYEGNGIKTIRLALLQGILSLSLSLSFYHPCAHFDLI